MSRLLMTIALGVTAYVTLPSPTEAADVVALRLPANTTVDPEGERRLISVGPDGTVAALAHSTKPTVSVVPRSLAIRWSSSGRRTSFVPPALQVSTGYLPPIVPSAVAVGRSVVYVSLDERFSGAYMGVIKSVERWPDGSRRDDELTGCAAGMNHDETVAGADALGHIAATVEATDVQLLLPEAYTLAPYAFVIDRSGCHARGRATMLDVHGVWASGYRAYLDHRIAPSNYGVDGDDFVAVRWHGDRLAELGEGVAYAISRSGAMVGATALAGREHGAVPQAVAWDTRGHRHVLEATSPRSVAYDVADDGTIVGMLEARDGRHYAFRRAHGKLERLDDLPHPAGWRFESAYAVTGDGTIVGIGTYRGFAMAFRWKPS